VSLKGFPQRKLRGDRTIYRIHKATRSPWWFSATGDGRFDPVGTGSGACYLADAPLGAWVEVFRKPQMLPEVEVELRLLLSVKLERDLRLADVTSRRALSFGVTASIGANEDFTKSQAFAAEASASGYDGVRYLVRHDPAQKLYGLALFGPAAAGPADRRWPRHSEAIPGSLIGEAERLFGYRVLPTP
jgi:RES domain-containing protein